MYMNKIVCFLNNTIQEISWISLYRDIFLILYRYLNFQYRPTLSVIPNHLHTYLAHT